MSEVTLIPEDGELEVLYEDECMFVVNKPSGLLSHPNPGHNDGSILNRIKAHGVELCGGDDPIRTGLVHRLDRQTTGVLILSKTQEAYEALQAEFKERRVEKTYHLLAYGKVKRMEMTVDKALARHPQKRNTRMVSEEGKPAFTRFKMLKMYKRQYSLWQAKPKTGRTHQIRVHILEGGLSVLGDEHYSTHDPHKAIKELGELRTMLHCLEIEIKHPLKDEVLSLKAPYPKDFAAVEEVLSSLH